MDEEKQIMSGQDLLIALADINRPIRDRGLFVKLPERKANINYLVVTKVEIDQDGDITIHVD